MVTKVYVAVTIYNRAYTRKFTCAI